MLLQHFHRIPELLFIFDKISLPQYGLCCKQIISTKSAQYFLLPQKKATYVPKNPWSQYAAYSIIHDHVTYDPYHNYT